MLYLLFSPSLSLSPLYSFPPRPRFLLLFSPLLSVFTLFFSSSSSLLAGRTVSSLVIDIWQSRSIYIAIDIWKLGLGFLERTTPPMNLKLLISLFFVMASSSSFPPKEPKKLHPRSDVWSHYTKRVDNNNKCNCCYCGREMGCSTIGGTTSLRKHLNICKSYLALQESNSQQTLTHGGISDGNIRLMAVSQDVFRQSVNEMIVSGELPISFVDGLAFKRFCSKVIPSYTLHSRRTATRDIIEMYMKEKSVLKNFFQVSKQRVSLTTDIWTAPTTNASYMVITAHFIDRSWHLKKKIIGFKHIIDHKGGSITNVLLECLDDWGIEKIFTITVDNATANSSALMTLKNTLKLRENALVQDGEFMHMRCCAHILNLIVRDGLHEVDASVTAIRNAVIYVRSSYSRLKSFELRVDTGKMNRGSLSLDCTTRWNSTYLMLTRALKFRLAFDKMLIEDKLYSDYFQEKNDGKKRTGPPTSEDWNNVQRLVKFLKIFYQSTLVVSGSNHVTSSTCYGDICHIESNLISLSNSLDMTLKTKATVMRAKFVKYWDGLEKINRLLIVASVFDPRKKMHFASLCFEKLYGKNTAKSIELKDSILDIMRKLFEEYNALRKKVDTSSQVGTSSQIDMVESSAALDMLEDDEVESLESIYIQMVKQKGIEDSNNELEIYLMEKVENVENAETYHLGMDFDILSWWRTNSLKFPVLSEIARDILAMQVSSTASESAFSTSGRILNPYRSCLTHYMIEVLMCTEQWLQFDSRSKQVDNITEMIEETEFFDSLAEEFGKTPDGR